MLVTLKYTLLSGTRVNNMTSEIYRIFFVTLNLSWKSFVVLQLLKIHFLIRVGKTPPRCQLLFIVTLTETPS